VGARAKPFCGKAANSPAGFAEGSFASGEIPNCFPDFARAFPYLPWISTPGSSWFIAVFGGF